ncbi:DUF4286 family protein [Crocinitomix algicola]|uniref:DUF4286 family protein n=1 Tax=Crocinitomix algicola TaxID=1740263 RepID=UPI0008733AFE|nr:DUF4286 family protein [Crocinitomix algicola]
MQVIYNVTVSVDVDRADEWLTYMKDRHIPDMMKTGQFIEAKISKVLGHEEGGTTYAIQYLCESMEVYENYQSEFAPALQADHMNKFGSCTAAFRTLLQVHQGFKV